LKNDVGERYKYTGQKEVVSIGLYYYGARYYDPGIGRFITEDTYQGELEVPQSQNLYVYVMNNPLKYVDPSGNYAIDEENASNITIEKGDTLSQIALDAYGSAEYVDLIAALNNIEDPDMILVGQQLNIPEPSWATEVAFDLGTIYTLPSNLDSYESCFEDTSKKGSYVYKKDITTGVIYSPSGLSRMRNVINIQVNTNPNANLELTNDKSISFKFEGTKIDISYKGIFIDANRQFGVGIGNSFASIKSNFLQEFKTDNFKVSPIKQEILPIHEMESPLYTPIYKQELSVSNNKGNVSFTYKHIAEWHQVTNAAAALLGYKGAVAAGPTIPLAVQRLLNKIPKKIRDPKLVIEN
jgi:RHS repeat-associated protein